MSFQEKTLKMLAVIFLRVIAIILLSGIVGYVVSFALKNR
jgi:hypothetical protein